MNPCSASFGVGLKPTKISPTGLYIQTDIFRGCMKTKPGGVSTDAIICLFDSAGCWVSQGPVPSTSLDAYEIVTFMISSYRDLSSFANKM